MPRKPKKPEGPTQETQPRYERGATGPPIEIPVPKRENVLAALRKVAKAPGSTRRRRPEE